MIHAIVLVELEHYLNGRSSIAAYGIMLEYLGLMGVCLSLINLECKKKNEFSF